MDFLTGLTNFTNWSGNVIMPTLAGIFFVIAILRAARSVPFQYAMYAGLMSLMVSGILRGIETFSRVRAWNDPDQVWVTLLGLVNWSANVFLPVYGVLQVEHVVYGLFLALAIVCAMRGVGLYAWAGWKSLGANQRGPLILQPGMAGTAKGMSAG